MTAWLFRLHLKNSFFKRNLFRYYSLNTQELFVFYFLLSLTEEFIVIELFRLTVFDRFTHFMDEKSFKICLHKMSVCSCVSMSVCFHGIIKNRKICLKLSQSFLNVFDYCQQALLQFGTIPPENSAIIPFLLPF